MKEIRVGIIGFGFMGKMHAYSYLNMPLYYNELPFRIKLVGVASRTSETAQKAQKILNCELATDNPDDVTGISDIDIVDVCSPNVFHKDIVIKALKAGKHVYCEKPLAVNYGEALEISEYLKDCPSVTQMAFQYRFLPATMRARQLIAEGRIGRILSFRVCYLHSGSVDPQKPIAWKQDKNWGGGVLLDLGSHILDLVYFLMGEYSEVLARSEIIYNKRPDQNGNEIEITAEDAVWIIAKMKNGGTGTIEASKVATGTNDELKLEVYGNRGAIRFNLMEPNWLEYFDNTLPEMPLGGLRGFTRIECVQRYAKPGGEFPASKVSIGWMRAHVHCLYHFLSHVYEGTQASPSIHDGVYIQQVMEKVYQSAQREIGVKIP